MKKQDEIRELPEKDLIERLDAEIIELNQLQINHTITKDRTTCQRIETRSIK